MPFRKLFLFFAIIFSACTLYAENCYFDDLNTYGDSIKSLQSAAECSANSLSASINSSKRIKKGREKGIEPIFLMKDYVFSSGDALSEDIFIPAWDKFREVFLSSFKKNNDVYFSSKEIADAGKKINKSGRKYAVYEISAAASSRYAWKGSTHIKYAIRINVSKAENGKNVFSQKAAIITKNNLVSIKGYQIEFPKRTEKNYFLSLSNPKPRLAPVQVSTRPVSLSDIKSLPLETAVSMEAPDPLPYEKISFEERNGDEDCGTIGDCDKWKLYKKGLARYEAGQYLQAMRIFTSLGLYENSWEYKQSCYYNYAAQLHNQGNYEESLRLHSSMKHYAQSKERLVLLKYNVGLKKLYSAPPDYNGAIYYLSKVEGFKNSELYLDEARILKYNQAALLNRNKEYDEAEKMFRELDWYRDSSARAKEVFYNKAKSKYLAKEYDDAMQMFRKLGNYEESKDFIKDILDIRYNAAVKLYNEKKYPEAAKEFFAIRRHLDSRLHANDSNYAQALLYLNAKKYEDALPLLKNLKDFADSRKFYTDIINLKALVPYEEGSEIMFGKYGGQDIIWKVMRKDYESMMLVCENGIEARKFDAKSSAWEQSALRAWLNGNFFKEWKEKDKQALIPFTNKGNKQSDRVFALSAEEAAALYRTDKERMAEASAEAIKSKEVLSKSKTTGKPPEEKHFVWQWLRDPGLVKGRAAAINPEGVIMFSGIAPDSAGITVRPAAWVKAEAFRQK